MRVLHVSRGAPENSVLINRLLFHLSRFSHRKELGILVAPLQPLLEPTMEEMHSHLQAHHPESLGTAERDWKMELFGMGSLKSQQQ